MSFIPFLLLSIGLSSQSVNFDHKINVVAALSLNQISNAQNPEPIENASRLVSDWGAIDTKRWGIYGSYGQDVKKSNNHLMTMGAEFEYFVEEDLSVDLGLLFMDVDQLGGDANGINFTLQLRWHAHKTSNYSFFIEGGAGMLRTSQNVPTGGSKFNFTPQAWTRQLATVDRIFIAFLRQWHKRKT